MNYQGWLVKKQKKDEEARPQTPDSGGGGYFTLSESDAGSNDDFEIRTYKNFNRSPKSYSRRVF